MAIDYTVIVRVRHQFGEEDLDIGVYAATDFEFPFDCPGVNPAREAVLLLQTSGVEAQQTMEVNGAVVFGGVPEGARILAGTIATSAGVDPHYHEVRGGLLGWTGNVMLVTPGVLRETGNVLRIATEKDAFVVDNVVILYKTGGAPVVRRPGGEVSPG